ncbi:MAG TPA: DUF4364 family protein [Candidatus Anaerotignum merdipullorum]|nr:DUF4364 family protein [Candidatus Anaerotignum merdipullorum]
MSDAIRQLAEHKLIILHLLQKMGIALSNSEICQFLLEKNYMDYFSVQQYLAELVDAGWLEKSREQNHTRYTLTDEGEETVNYFLNHISEHAKTEINTYVQENSKRIRAEYAVTANYFPEINDDFLVKCGLNDDNGNVLMEVSVSVVSKQQALAICRNWRKNVSHLYGSILTSLVKDTEAEHGAFKAKQQNFPPPAEDPPES